MSKLTCSICKKSLCKASIKRHFGKIHKLDDVSSSVFAAHLTSGGLTGDNLATYIRSQPRTANLAFSVVHLALVSSSKSGAPLPDKDFYSWLASHEAGQRSIDDIKNCKYFFNRFNHIIDSIDRLNVNNLANDNSLSTSTRKKYLNYIRLAVKYLFVNNQIDLASRDKSIYCINFNLKSIQKTINTQRFNRLKTFKETSTFWLPVLRRFFMDNSLISIEDRFYLVNPFQSFETLPRYTLSTQSHSDNSFPKIDT